MTRSPYALAAFLALGVALLLGGLTAVTVPAGNLPDENAAKEIDKCQTEITKRGVKFVENKLKKLAKCVDEVVECIQKEDDESVDGCIEKATGKCDKEIAKIFDKDEPDFHEDILKKCVDEDLVFTDLTSPIGLGFDTHQALCTNQFASPLTAPENVADCTVAHNECLTEQLFRIQAPRALELMLFAEVDQTLLDQLPCLEGAAGVGAGFGNIDSKNTGKPIEKCHKEIEKRTRTFIKKKLKSIEKCTGDLFECVQEDPGDQKCIDKAIGKCDKEFGPGGKIAKEETTLREKVAKKCDADEIDYASLRGTSGLNLDDLAVSCTAVGAPTLDDIDDYIECLFRQTECLVDDIMRIQTPRLNELLTIAGRETEVPAPFCVTPTPTPTATPTPTTTATFTPNPGEFLVAVTKLGTGMGTVTSDPAGIDCGDTCAASFPGSNIDLHARTANGDDAYFTGWGGDCQGALNDCDNLLVNQHRFIDATFAPQEFNLVFKTSDTFELNLGGVAPYDAACNNVATAAGLNTLANDGFSAWMGVSGSTAPTRLGAARGFVRMDGAPIADEVSDLTGFNQIFNAIRYDENGRPGVSLVPTGTAFNGSVGSNCTGWTTNSAGVTALQGSMISGPTSWTHTGNALCSFVTPIYCFGKTKTAELIPPVAAGKVIYLSEPYTVGDDRDAHCGNVKPLGVGTVKALVATTAAAADTLLAPGTTYVRPDGQVIGTGAEIIAVAAAPANDPLLTSGIWQAGSGDYIGGGQVATGQDNMTDVGTIASTCNDWTDSGGTLSMANIGALSRTFWNGSDNQSCSLTTRRIYCVEQ